MSTMIKMKESRELTSGQAGCFSKPHIEVTLHMADVMKKLGEYEKAIEIYNRVLDMDPGEIRARHAKSALCNFIEA